MNNVNLYNQNGDPNSLQISYLKDIPTGNFEIVKGAHPVLIKNITQEDIEIQVKLYRMDDFINTIIYPGWNPELVIALKDVKANTLQYGN